MPALAELFRREFSRVERYRDHPTGSRWVTINGSHVQIDGNKIVKGPAALVGKAPDAAQPSSKPADEAAAPAAGSIPINVRRVLAKAQGGKRHIGGHVGDPLRTWNWLGANGQTGEDGSRTYGFAEGGLRMVRDSSGFKLEWTGAEKPAEQVSAHQEPESKPAEKSFGPGVANLPDGRKIGVTQLRVSDLSSAPHRFQYKVSGITAEGVTEELKEVRKYRPEFGGQLLVWHDPADGKTYVVNGHHRYELAKRSDYQGYIPVFMIDAHNEKEARAIGALANIAEGRGSALDAAKFFRESGRSIDDVRNEGISLKGKVAEDGVTLSKLSDRLFQATVSGNMREGRALAIAKELPDRPEFQDKLADILAKSDAKGRDIPDAVVFEMAREMKDTPTKKEEHTDLFGSWEDERSLFLERNQMKAAIRKELTEQAVAFRAVSSEARAERLAETGNVINTGANQERAHEARGLVWLFDKLANSKGEISDALNSAAEQLAGKPRSIKSIVKTVLPGVAKVLQANAGTVEPYSLASAGNPGSRKGDGIRCYGAEESPLVAMFREAFAAVRQDYAARPKPIMTGDPQRDELTKEQWKFFPPPKAGLPLNSWTPPKIDHSWENPIRALKPLAGQREAFSRGLAEQFARAGLGRLRYAWNEADHPRGQPENAGEFGPGNNSGQKPAHTGATGRPPGGQGPHEVPPRQDGPAEDPTTPPPPGPAYNPDPAKTGESRVGVPAMSTPPPPALQPLPNLSPDERQVEQAFMQRFQADPAGLAEQYRRLVYGSQKPKTFETDAAKVLSPDWSQPGQPDEARKKAQAEWNTALHATANAIAKRAFVAHLDDVAKLPPAQRHCLVTAGGCGAGKGFALGHVDRAKSIQDMTAAVWDAAGDQNSAEMPWVHAECKKRGIPCTFMYVHADPDNIWANPERGVVQRANKEGRMVDARVFADSHTHGARNFAQFAASVANDPSAEFMYLDNARPAGEQPVEMPGIPPQVLQRDPEELYRKSLAHLESADVNPAVKRGGTAGTRLWPERFSRQRKDLIMSLSNRFEVLRLSALLCQAQREYYAKHKPLPGQKSMFGDDGPSNPEFEAKISRDDDGKFAEQPGSKADSKPEMTTQEPPKNNSEKSAEPPNQPAAAPVEMAERGQPKSGQQPKEKAMSTSTSSSAVRAVKSNGRVYFEGNTYPVKDKIKAMGGHWDGDRKQWWVGAAKASEAEALAGKLSASTTTGSSHSHTHDGPVTVVGKASYKGRTYYVRWTGTTKSGAKKSRLTTLDGKLDFWVDADAAPMTKRYDEARSLSRIARYVEGLKKAGPAPSDNVTLRGGEWLGRGCQACRDLGHMCPQCRFDEYDD